MNSHLLFTTPKPSSSPIQHKLSQRNHIPSHIYKHPAAILLELCNSIQELRQITPLIIKNNLLKEELFQTKLVSLFCKYNSLTEATTVFERIEDKTDPLYHTILKGYAQNGSFSDGFSFFCRMMEDGVEPVVYNFTYLLKGCGENGLVRKGKEVHGQVILTGNDKDIYVMTCVVNMYAKCGLIEDAHQVFVKMPERDLVCWNTIISGYSQNGFAKKSIELLSQMQEDRLRPDLVTLISILPSIGNLGDLRIGKSIHGYVFKSEYEGHGNVCTALLDMYVKCKSFRTARVLFDEMSNKSVVTWNIMIDGYVQNGDSVEAISLFKKMLDDGVKPTGVTFMAVLHACAESGDLVNGEFVHRLIEKLGLNVDVSVMNSLISMYCKCKRIDIASKIFENLKNKQTLVSWNAMILGYAQNGRAIEGLDLFRRMKSELIEPDSFTMVSVIGVVSELSILLYAKWIHGVVVRSWLDGNVFVKTALVDMYAKCGSITIARKLFDSMEEKHVTTWNAMIDGCGTHGRVNDAISLFETMENRGIKPNNVTFLCMISACSHSGLVEEGIQYFSIMKEKYKIEPTMDHYGAMVDLLGRSGRILQAWDFIVKMPVDPKVNVYGAMLGACKIHKNVEFGEMVAKRLFDLNPRDGGYYVLLANLYSSVSMWDKVGQIRSEMEQRGIRKTPGFSSIDFGNKVHTFYSGSSWHFESEKIYEFLEMVFDKIRDVGYVSDTDSIHDSEDGDLGEKVAKNIHSEKLAIAFGLLSTKAGTTIHIRKNLRVCGDCHTFTKFVSLVERREIVVRDLHRFHHFKNGICSCGDYW